MTTGDRIREKRKSKGWTQKQLAEKCNMADSAIRKYESNTINPKIPTLERIAAALGCTFIDLMFDEGTDFTDMIKFVDRDEEYIKELRVPALKLNEAGRELLLNNAKEYAKKKELTEVNGEKD